MTRPQGMGAQLRLPPNQLRLQLQQRLQGPQQVRARRWWFVLVFVFDFHPGKMSLLCDTFLQHSFKMNYFFVLAFKWALFAYTVVE